MDNRMEGMLYLKLPYSGLVERSGQEQSRRAPGDTGRCDSFKLQMFGEVDDHMAISVIFSPREIQIKGNSGCTQNKMWYRNTSD
ncbi:hypothetical protein ILYODFUR_027054 [Ilyodon furcidens]|uniref:Uncharacterized protein n=1 Tax=Ilyodon furcidens TaxID=33524 RepID=A0ABV0TM14_9TELE